MVEVVVNLLRKKGAEGLAYKISKNNRSVSSTIEGPERIFERITEGIGIVAFVDGKKAFVSVANPAEENLKEAVETAIEMAKFTEADDGNVVSDDVEFDPIEGLYDKSVEKYDLAKLKEISLGLVERAKSYDPRIKFIRGASATVSTQEIKVMTTKGVDKHEKVSMAQVFIMCSAVDEKGGSMGYKFRIARSLESFDPYEVATEAAEEAIGGLGAEVEKTGVYDIILSPETIAMLFSIGMWSFSGEVVYKKSSFLKKEDIGKKLFSENVSLINDAKNPKFMGASSFDAEGTNTKRFYVVENGVLKSFFHNLYSAKKLGMSPTGNAAIDSFRSAPSVSPMNLRMEANANREKIFESVKKGIYVTHMMGAHTLDPVSGRFSVQISGYLVEDGKKVKPIRGMALSGTLSELLSSIELVADDYKDYGSVVGSTTLVRGMSVGGK
ncbi:MAG: TldD/PmbA family protein [Thermotogaceae bacterium]|nr:TldD/PmbA family protein [Thermotogaceae bacterium]